MTEDNKVEELLLVQSWQPFKMFMKLLPKEPNMGKKRRQFSSINLGQSMVLVHIQYNQKELSRTATNLYCFEKISLNRNRYLNGGILSGVI